MSRAREWYVLAGQAVASVTELSEAVRDLTDLLGRPRPGTEVSDERA